MDYDAVVLSMLGISDGTASEHVTGWSARGVRLAIALLYESAVSA